MIHPTAIIGPNVKLGDNCHVEAHCILGEQYGQTKGPLLIGDNAIIRAGTIIYGGSTYGDHLETGHHTLLRSGNNVGVNLRIGSYSSLEGGAHIGDYVRIHGRCEMTKGVLKDFTRIYGGTYITDNRRPPSYHNEPCVLEPGAVVTMGCILLAGVHLGLGSYVAAGLVVADHVAAGHMLLRDGTQRKLRTHWIDQYRDDYPAEAQHRLTELRDQLHAL